MDTTTFADFPREEIKAFNAVCRDCNVDQGAFWVFAIYPENNSSAVMRKSRIIHVLHEPTGREQQYLVVPELQDWLGPFRVDLREGYYTGVAMRAKKVPSSGSQATLDPRREPSPARERTKSLSRSARPGGSN